MGVVRGQRHPLACEGQGLSPYLSLSAVLQGMALLTQQLFGLALTPVRQHAGTSEEKAASRLETHGLSACCDAFDIFSMLMCLIHMCLCVCGLVADG
jgi:hypothetical protein